MEPLIAPVPAKCVYTLMRENVVGFLHLELDPKKPGKSVKTAIGKCLTE